MVAVGHGSDNRHDHAPGALGRLGLRELWGARELIYFFTKRELQIRYKQSLFGVGWAVLQPLALTIRLRARPRPARAGGVGRGPVPIFALTRPRAMDLLLPVDREGGRQPGPRPRALSKVYFPRIVIPLGAVLSFLIDLAISLVILVCLFIVFGVEVSRTAPLVVRPARPRARCGARSRACCSRR